MDEIKINKDQVTLKFSADEMLLISNSLNEICNGIEVNEFETRIETTEDQARILLKAMSFTFRKMQQEIDKKANW